LKPDRRLYEAAGDPCDSRAFLAAAKENGYHDTSKKWNGADRVAERIVRMPSHTRIGDGVRAAAILCLAQHCASDRRADEMLWEMAARAGFTPPAEIAKRLRRKNAAVATAPKQRDAKVVSAQVQMAEADKDMEKLLSSEGQQAAG
jgi:hypothetical protein